MTLELQDPPEPGFLIFGAGIAFDIGATMVVEALGSLAAGCELNLPDIIAHFDILNDGSSGSGLMRTGPSIADIELTLTSTARSTAWSRFRL
jgi:hypothetical protein